MEETIQISKWKLERIEDAIRITLNAFKMRTKETCLFREMCKASEFAKEALLIDFKMNNNFKTDFKEYLFNTANHNGSEKNIEEWYLKQTLKFIEEWEKKNE